MDRHRSSSRRTAVVAGLIAVAIAAVGTVYVINRSGGHRNADQTAWQHVMSGTTESGETTVAVARQAFSLTFEPLPGVEVPAGSRSDIQSGSAALRMMIAHWSELTADEQNVVLSYLPCWRGRDCAGSDLGRARHRGRRWTRRHSWLADRRLCAAGRCAFHGKANCRSSW